MYGSHSDIGGGYAELDKYEPVLGFFDVPAKDTTILNEMQKYRNFYLNTQITSDSSVQFFNTYDHYKVTTFHPYPGNISKGNVYTDNDVTREPKYKEQIPIFKIPGISTTKPAETDIRDPSKPHVIKEEKIADHYVLKDSRYISNKFALIPMNLMLQEAIDKKVPFYEDFNTAPDVKRKTEYELPDDKKFIEYYNFMKEIVKTKNETTDTVYNIPKDIYKHITKNYIHLSAHYGGLKNDFLTVETGDHHFLESLVFINQPVAAKIVDGVVKYEREIYP